MRHPLLIVAMLYACGLLLADRIPLALPLPFAFAFAVALAAIAWKRARPWLLPPLILLAGWSNMVSRIQIVSPHDVRTLVGESPADVRVRGTLVTTPVERLPAQNSAGRSRTVAELSLSAMQSSSGEWQPARGRIFGSTPGTLSEQFFAGQEVEISGVIAHPPRATAEGLFDYRAHLTRNEIHYTLRSSGPEEWRRISSEIRPPLSDRFLAWAKATTARGLPEEDQALHLIWAMALGARDVLASDAYEPFVQSGTMHIFAISGLHIALIAGILVSLLRVAQISRMWCGLIVIPLLWFYAAATGWQSSAVRSTVMMSVVVAGWSLRRPTNLLNSLAAAALIILLWDPQQLFRASFQLSFCVVLSIALVLPPLKRRADQWFRPDPLLPANLVPRWQRCLEWPVRVVLAYLATSLAAWLGSWPLTAFYFHMMSPVTLLANVVMVPLSSAALACTLGSLVCGAWLPWATELFNHAAWFWMTVMMRLSEAATQAPGAYWYVRGPGVADLVIYYAALIAVLSGAALNSRSRWWTLAAVIPLCGFYSVRWHHERQTTDLTVLPLNGGCAVYCDRPGRGADVLIDCGNTNSVRFVTQPFLRAQGVNALPCLALTHGDVRQVGGAPLLDTNLTVKQIATSSVRFRSRVYREIIESLKTTPERHVRLERGGIFRGWKVLHPSPSDSFSQADDNALVLIGEFHGTRVLLLSDLGRPGQNALLERTPDLRADIVVAGLPEKTEPICDALLDAIQPRLIIVADSEYPATKRASAALRDRLKGRRVPVFYTRTSGAVKLSLEPKGWKATAMDGSEASFP